MHSLSLLTPTLRGAQLAKALEHDLPPPQCHPACNNPQAEPLRAPEEPLPYPGDDLYKGGIQKALPV